MTLDPVRVLARTISGISAEQDTIKQNLSADESDSQLAVNFTFNVLTQGTVTATSLLYTTDSFIIDHSIYGKLDSLIYKLDVGYKSATVFPLTFPVSFTIAGSQLYKTTF